MSEKREITLSINGRNHTVRITGYENIVKAIQSAVGKMDRRR